MDIIEAINKRKSIRGFKPDPVPQAVLKEIIELALRAPSWANTQPWDFVIVTGDKLEEVRQGFIEKAEEPVNPDILRPQEFPEPYDSRRHTLAAGVYEVKGIAREDREKRGWWRLKGFRHFEAPCVIYICIERSFYFQPGGLNAWSLFDCGLIAENIMLLATRYGLGTIPQAQSVVYPDVLRRVLKISDFKLIALGIAIGYPDWDDPVNKFRSDRESVDKVTNWIGFEF